MDEYEKHPKIVAATKGDTTEYWAVATLREYAVDSVRAALSPAWRISMTERRLPIETAQKLRMRRTDVRKLPPGIQFLP
jgi:hypothetical protein